MPLAHCTSVVHALPTVRSPLQLELPNVPALH